MKLGFFFQHLGLLSSFLCACRVTTGMTCSPWGDVESGSRERTGRGRGRKSSLGQRPGHHGAAVGQRQGPADVGRRFYNRLRRTAGLPVCHPQPRGLRPSLRGAEAIPGGEQCWGRSRDKCSCGGKGGQAGKDSGPRALDAPWAHQTVHSSTIVTSRQ